MAIAGKLIGFQVDGTYTPCETSCSMNLANEQLDASSESNGNWRYSIEGYKSWSMSVSGKLVIRALNSSFNRIFVKNLLPNQVYDVFMGTIPTFDQPEIIVRGKARITTLDWNANLDSVSDYTIQFVGLGAPEEVSFEEFALIINANPAYADKDIIVNMNW